MSKKLTKEMIEELIKEELAKAEQERLNEFTTVRIKKDKLGRTALKSAIGIDDNAFKSTAGVTSYKDAEPVWKSLAGLDGSTSDLEDADFKAAWDKAESDALNQFADNIYNASSKKSDPGWAAIGGTHNPAGSTPPGSGTGPWGPGNKYVAVPSKAAPLYKAIEVALTDYSNGINRNDAKDALTAYADQYTAKGYKKKAPKAIAGTTGMTWVDVINAAISGSTVSPTLAQAALKDLAKVLTTYEPQDISRPEMATVGAEKSQFAQDAIFAFDGLFKAQSASTLENRVKAISKLSEAMVKGKKNTLDALFGYGATGLEKRAFLNGIVCMDYIAKFAKEIDHGAGAYFFEAFCALITGGEVKGKGGLAGDFTLALDPSGTGSGSSKYLNTYASSQAVSGFKPGVPVQYIGAFKRKDTTSAISKAGTSAPEEIVVIDFYLFQITLSNVNQTKATKNTLDKNKTTKGLTTSFTGTKTVKIEFNYKNLTPAATVHLATKKNESFQQALENQVKKSDQDLQDSYDLFKEYFVQTRKADVQVKSYLGSGDLNKGTEALRAITEADDQMVAMFNLLRPSSGGVSGSGAGRKLTENKMTELDLMVENMVKQFLKGN